MVSSFFNPETAEDQKKGLRRKITGFLQGFCLGIPGFLVQMRFETKQNVKARSSPQVSGVVVSGADLC